MSFTNEKYNLTEGEQKFIQEFLSLNMCGAETPEDLLADNFSCQSFIDLAESMTYTKPQIKGYLSSLDRKSVIMIEERDYRDGPDLFWVEDSYLESLPSDSRF